MIKKPFEGSQTDQTIDLMNRVNLQFVCLYDRDLPQNVFITPMKSKVGGWFFSLAFSTLEMQPAIIKGKKSLPLNNN